MNNEIDYGRSIGAIVGGFFVMTALGLLTGMLAFKLFLPTVSAGETLTPTTTFLIVRMALNFLTAFVGGYVAAAISGAARLAHALILAGIIMVISMIGLALAARLNPGAPSPGWYEYSSGLLVPAGVVIGGWYRSRKN